MWMMYGCSGNPRVMSSSSSRPLPRCFLTMAAKLVRRNLASKHAFPNVGAGSQKLKAGQGGGAVQYGGHKLHLLRATEELPVRMWAGGTRTKRWPHFTPPKGLSQFTYAGYR